MPSLWADGELLIIPRWLCQDDGLESRKGLGGSGEGAAMLWWGGHQHPCSIWAGLMSDLHATSRASSES